MYIEHRGLMYVLLLLPIKIVSTDTDLFCGPGLIAESAWFISLYGNSRRSTGSKFKQRAYYFDPPLELSYHSTVIHIRAIQCSWQSLEK